MIVALGKHLALKLCGRLQVVYYLLSRHHFTGQTGFLLILNKSRRQFLFHFLLFGQFEISLFDGFTFLVFLHFFLLELGLYFLPFLFDSQFFTVFFFSLSFFLIFLLVLRFLHL